MEIYEAEQVRKNIQKIYSILVNHAVPRPFPIQTFPAKVNFPPPPCDLFNVLFRTHRDKGSLAIFRNKKRMFQLSLDFCFATDSSDIPSNPTGAEGHFLLKLFIARKSKYRILTHTVLTNTLFIKLQHGNYSIFFPLSFIQTYLKSTNIIWIHERKS